MVAILLSARIWVESKGLSTLRRVVFLSPPTPTRRQRRDGPFPLPHRGRGSAESVGGHEFYADGVGGGVGSSGSPGRVR